ncbi:Transcriptional activator protein [Wickerhamomyces ciferrii]|uniref:Transcriptional activator protein n=1 Tax=Wickerhamomyces ciferrii (strain ATCC 14091 / BCRC 22168 / CBS 111 / JCM 3599 / NBRC 0793 / NRRL Y-1031 F-60-10) TaxID=1206466 RepID=K0KGF3_WICCF|nr:Transcriptional activator protein [Wickerhamomyces ciferrii]CCH42051.1 Transcriptional activator protein [Wickerhamomyces ciferrii]
MVKDKSSSPSTTDTTKLIKTAGNGGLTRTSQACDRCRIKKIKCDGKIPSCTNCLSIGYNCQTSDKLTRRAFPRGYTENLEKNLISLQNENSKLITELETFKSKIAGQDVGNVSNSEHESSSTPSIIIPDNTVSIHIKEEPISDPHHHSCGSEPTIKGLSDNFFMFDNFVENENYVGLNSLNLIFNNILKNFKLQPIEELKFPKVDFHNLSDFIIAKFLIKFPSKTNLDLLISNHFENLNLIPILDEDLFFKNYKEIFNSIDNKTENLIPLIENSTDDDEILVFVTKLIIMIQLNCSIFSLHEIHKLVTSLNISFKPSITKFQTTLLSLYLFHNKNCYKDTVINLNNILHSMVLSLGLHLNYNNLKQSNLKIQLTKEEKFKLHSVRLKLYWSFYILSNIASISHGLPQVGFFEKFHIPHLNTILNSNQNLKNCILLIDILQNLENINLQSINQDFNQFNKLDEFLVNWRDELKLQNLFHKIPLSIITSMDNSNERPTKRLKKSKILSSHEENTKIQLNLFYIYFRMLIHLQQTSENISLNQSDVILSNLSKEFLAYIILLDSRKELNNLNNFEFHLIPINFLKMILISMLNLVKVSKSTNHQDQLFTDSSNSNILIKVLKIVKNRYPENFVLFKQIVDLVKLEFQLNDPDLEDSTDFNNKFKNLSSSPQRHPSIYQHSELSQQIDQHSLLFDLDQITNRNLSVASAESTISNSSIDTMSINGTTNQNYNTDQTDSSSSINDEQLPDITSNLDLIFDWNTTPNPNPIKPSSNFHSSLNHPLDNYGVNSYDLNLLVHKNEL